MASAEDLNNSREMLVKALGGDKSKLYFQHMKLWFQMKYTKEQFDCEVRRMLDSKQAHLHNQFLLHLYFKCSKPDLPTSSTNCSCSKAKRRAGQSNCGFQQTNVQEFAPTRIIHRPLDDPPRYCVQELRLPDQELIHMRLLVAAWEMGLKGAETSAAEIMVAAVRMFLRNIITAVLSHRNGFRVRDKQMQYGLGIPVPNPWLKNTAGIAGSRDDGPVTEVMDTGESVPAGRPPLTEMQQDIALTYASSLTPAKKAPISLIELFHTLQIDRRIVPSHGVYSINMERLAAKMSHPSWDELDIN